MTPTPPGLFAVVGALLLLTALSVSLVVSGTGKPHRAGQVLTPFFALLMIGIWVRWEWTRKVVLGLFAVLLAGDVIMFVVNALALTGLVPSVPPSLALDGVAVEAIRGPAWAWMIFYLRREEVRALFRARARKPAPGP